MAKATPMTEDQLRAITDAEMRQAVGDYGGKLAEMRRKAEVYYLAEAKDDLAPPEVEGRSSVISPDVRNTVEAMLPQLMVKFTGGDTVVEFEPTQPDDELAAKNCTDYLNYLFFKKNNGHQVTYTWFKDALLQKRGFLKVWWDDRSEETREEYRGQTQVNLAMLMDDPELEIIDQKSYPDEEDAKQRQQALEQLQQQLDQAMTAAQQGNQQAAAAIGQLQQQMQGIQQQPPAMLYDVAAKRTKKGGKVCIENVPPEEMLISRKAKMDLQQCPFVGHRVARTMSELKSMGYKNIEDLSGDDQAMSLNLERVERLGWDDEQAYLNLNEVSLDDSQKVIWVTECYLRADYDGDGIAELRKVVRAGNKILENEVIDAIPFVSVCPVPMPHKFFGLSIADLGFEGQKTNTAILRAMLDNLYLEVNGRYFAVDGQVNLDDLLGSRPGGVVRIKSQGSVGRLDQGKGNLGESMQMLEYMKQFVEDATGWSRNSTGTDPQALGQTATATQIVTNKADMRLDLIARNFAEGFVELFRMMLKLVSQYQDKAASVKLSGQWVDMDPREWRNQFDVSINVGLGMGNKDQMVQHLMVLQQAQGHGLAIGIATPTNLYESSLELAKNMGFKAGDKFFTKPDPNKPPPNPAAQEMQAKMQIEQMKVQAQSQVAIQSKQAELQVETQRMQLQAQVDQAKQAAQAQQVQQQIAQEMQMKREQAAMDLQLEQSRMQMQMQLEREKAQFQAQTAIEVAKIGAEGKIAAAEATASTTLSAQQGQAADDAVSE